MNRIKTTEINKHFSNRSDKYDLLGTWVNNDLVLSSIASHLPTSNDGVVKIVDLGAGTGAVSQYILKEYSYEKSIIAVDFCSDMLAKITQPNIKKCLASLDSLPFLDNEFDVAISRQCLHYVEDLRQAIREIKRTVKNKGTFILAQIVPFDEKSKDYWSKVIKFRQPLRIHYYSEKDWIDVFSIEGFSVFDTEHFSHKGSVQKWAQKYNITDANIVDEYKKLLLNAPKEFIEKYNVIEKDDDVIYDSFWLVAKFILEK